MKTNALHYTWAAGALLVFTLTGCNNENELPADNGKEAGKLMTITATQNDATTRLAHLDTSPNAEGSSLGVTWEVGDAFMLYKDGVGQKFSTTEKDAATVPFTGLEPTGTGSTYQAFYPHSRAQQKWADNYISVQGQVQVGSAGTTHLSEYDYMTVSAWDGTGNLNFVRQVAVLKFIVTLPNSKCPERLSLSRQDNSDLAVGLKVGKSDAAPETAKHLDMKIVKNAAGDAADFSTFTAYMCVLKSTLADGKPLAVSITCTDGTHYSYKVDNLSGRTYDAGYIYYATLTQGKLQTQAADFGNSVVASDQLSGTGVQDDPYLISSAGDLKYFIEQVNTQSNTYAGKYVKLTTDIRITASTWTPIGKTAAGFEGIFDGGGHTISGEMSNSDGTNMLGFFDSFKGSVSNLHVSATLKYIGINTAARIGAIVCNSSSSDASTTISHCTFSGKISITGTWVGRSTAYIGGIIAGVNGPCTISHCTSMADIDVNQAGGGLFLGGIIGGSTGFYGSNKIYHCLNTGNISVGSSTRTGASSVGGIIGESNGYATPNTPNDIQYCRNKGSISISSGTAQYAGGIVGNALNTNVHTSHNENANITVVTVDGYKGSLCGKSDSNSNIYDCCTGPSSIPMIGGSPEPSLKPDVPANHID